MSNENNIKLETIYEWGPWEYENIWIYSRHYDAWAKIKFSKEFQTMLVNSSSIMVLQTNTMTLEKLVIKCPLKPREDL